MNTKKAKKILGKEANKYSNKQLEKIILGLSNLADIFIDQQKGLVNYGKPNIQ